MLKRAVQQGRSERRGEAYASVRCASERSENDAGGLFQHPANEGTMIPLHDDNPTKLTPVVTIASIAVCTLVFLYQASLPAGSGEIGRAHV